MTEIQDTNPTILIVEDNADTSTMLRRLLEQHDYHVLEVADGQTAVKIAEHICPDLILMDLDLPVMDGFEATRLIRLTKELCNAPILAISALSVEENREKALAAGCNEYLSKPLDNDELVYLLGMLLHSV